jgi:hypothetical protein
VNSVGSAAAAIHRHEVYSVGPYIRSILVWTVLVNLVNPPGASFVRKGHMSVSPLLAAASLHFLWCVLAYVP